MNKYNVYIPAMSDDALHRCNCTKSEAIEIAKGLAKEYENEGGVFVTWETSFFFFSFTVKIERLIFQTETAKR